MGRLWCALGVLALGGGAAVGTAVPSTAAAVEPIPAVAPVGVTGAGVTAAAVAPAQGGYWLLAGDGGLFSFGPPFFGSAAGNPDNCAQPMFAPPMCSLIVPTRDRRGYWIVNPLGGGAVFPFGDASDPGQPRDAYADVPDFMQPGLVALLPSPSGSGYLAVEDNGDVIADGDAVVHGTPPVAPACTSFGPNPCPFSFYVGAASTPSGRGYWVVNSAGAVFAFGDAVPYGSAANLHLNQPITAMVATADGGGYWLLGRDGGIFSFGDARFYGSTGGLHLNGPIVGMASTPTGGGYWLVGSDGGVFSFGDARFFGSTGNLHLNQPVTAIAAG